MPPLPLKYKIHIEPSPYDNRWDWDIRGPRGLPIAGSVRSLASEVGAITAAEKALLTIKGAQIERYEGRSKFTRKYL